MPRRLSPWSLALCVVSLAVSAACGQDAAGRDAAPPNPRACNGGAVGTVLDNHGHAPLEIPAEHVSTPAVRTYDLTTTETHPHTVRLQPEDFARLVADGELTVFVSMELSHTHGVAIECE